MLPGSIPAAGVVVAMVMVAVEPEDLGLFQGARARDLRWLFFYSAC